MRSIGNHGYRHRPHHRRRGAAVSFERPARQIVDCANQAPGHPARPVLGLFARRRLPVPPYPARPEHRLRLHLQGQFRRGHLQRHGGPGAGQSRRAGGKAGHGGQGGPLQTLCRHRLDRPRDRHARCRRVRQLRALPAPGVRRHQPRGHPRARVLCHRRAAARTPRHPGIPRRPARHRDHHLGRADQRAAPDRARAGGGPDGGQRRRRGVYRLCRIIEVDGAAERQRRPVRHQGGDLSRAHRRHEPMEVGPCGRDHRAHPRRGDRGRRCVLRSVGQGRDGPGDGPRDGRPADHLCPRQSRPGDHPRGGARRAGRCDHRHRALRLPQPGQQYPRVSLHLSRRPRRARLADQRRDEDRRGRGAGPARARGCARRGRRRLCRRAAALRPGLHHSGAVRSAPHLGGAVGGGAGGDGFGGRAEAHPRHARLPALAARPSRPDRGGARTDLRKSPCPSKARRLRRGRGGKDDPRRAALCRKRLWQPGPDRPRGAHPGDDGGDRPQRAGAARNPQRGAVAAQPALHRLPLRPPAAPRHALPRLPAAGEPGPQRVRRLHGCLRRCRGDGDRAHPQLVRCARRGDPGHRCEARARRCSA